MRDDAEYERWRMKWRRSIRALRTGLNGALGRVAGKPTSLASASVPRAERTAARKRVQEQDASGRRRGIVAGLACEEAAELREQDTEPTDQPPLAGLGLVVRRVFLQLDVDVAVADIVQAVT